MMSCTVSEVPALQLASEREIRMMSPAQRLHFAVRVTLPHSEVCLHMRLAGQTRPVLPVANNMAQILNDDGSTFSFPVTRGEAGLAYTPEGDRFEGWT